MDMFRSIGLKIEQTYTAKAAAAFLDELEKSESAVLFWNTFNSRDIAAKANLAKVHLLPSALRKYAQEGA
jgi:hypothetical protein